MKKTILLSIIFAASLCAGDTNETAKATNAPPAKVEAPAPAPAPQKPVVTPDELYQLIVLARKSTTGQLHENFRAVQQLLMLCDKVEAAITQRP